MGHVFAYQLMNVSSWKIARGWKSIDGAGLKSAPRQTMAGLVCNQDAEAEGFAKGLESGGKGDL